MTVNAWSILLFAGLVVLFLIWCKAYHDAPEANVLAEEPKVIGTKSVTEFGHILGYYIDGADGRCMAYYPNGEEAQRSYGSETYATTPLYSDDPLLLRKVW